MPRRLEFFFDCVSPFSYLANSQGAAIAERTGAELVYRPFLLGGVMQATGNQPPATLPARGKYMPKDIGRWVRRYAIPFRFNPSFPMKTLRRSRASSRRTLADPAVLRDLIAKAGLDPAPLLAAAATKPIKEKLKANTAEAVERGAFGAPTFFVGDEIFFGNDRLDFVEEVLRA